MIGPKVCNLSFGNIRMRQCRGVVAKKTVCLSFMYGLYINNV